MGTAGGKVRIIGTRYHLADTYSVMMERRAVKPRIHPATQNGMIDGKPVFFTPEEWERRKRTQSAAMVNAQLLQNPLADGKSIYKQSWFKLWPASKAFPRFEYVILSLDTAFTKETQNDPTAATVWGVFDDRGSMAVMMLDAWDERIEFPALRQRVMLEYESRYGINEKKVDIVLIEEKGSGISLIQE